MRLLLEGSDIETLLAQIRREHGEAARIVAADRVRSGGIAGFFARLRYEVTVEIDERSSSSVQVLTAGEPEESDTQETVLAPLAPPASPAPPASLLDLAEAVDAAEQHAFAPLSPPISTEGNGFAAVLRQLAEGMAPEDAPATPDAAGSISSEPDLSNVDSSEADPSIAAPVFPAPAFADPSIAAPAFAPAPAFASPPAFASFPTAVAVAYAPHLGADGTETPATGSVVRVMTEAAAETADAVAAAERWNALGLPAGLHPTLGPGVTVHQALRAAMHAVPQARFTKRAGDVVAVVGEARQAYEGARRLAELLRIDPATVALAAATDCVPGVPKVKRLLSPEDARRHARQLRRLPHVAIVAVESTLEAEGSEWAMDVTDALEADRVWAVVDATTKTADVRRQLDRLAPVDALLLTNARHTSDPAAVLSLDVPVATLDGARATPAAWARMLTASLLEAA